MYEETIKKLVDKANETFAFNSKRVAELGRKVTDSIESTIKNKASISKIEVTLRNERQFDFYVSKSGKFRSFEEVGEHIYKQRQLGKLKRQVRVFVSDLEVSSQTQLKESRVTYYLSDAVKIFLEEGSSHGFVVDGSSVKIEGGFIEYKNEPRTDSENIAVYAKGEKCMVFNMKIKNARYPRPFAGVYLEENIQTFGD